ncbi:hypothetical protein ACFV1N_46615 [Streptosporangium canum]|uniref:hypothetical protein n=1 Tax=Streptosporangium canum TaxID=324952 RepID=UPI0036921BA7
MFLTDRKARPSVALVDVHPRTSRARLSYRRAAEVFEQHTTDLPGGPYTLHQLRHSGLTHAAEDGASTPMLMGCHRSGRPGRFSPGLPQNRA